MPIQEAAPIVVEPSGNFLGDDGSWSTFTINAGSPPQLIEVFASTEVASTWVVAPDGCGDNDAANCTQARGGFYDDTKSSTWNSKGVFLLGSEVNLGYTAANNAVNGTYGYDKLALPGAAAVSVDHQVLAAIITDKFYVGSLGLSNQPINITDSSDSSPSLITSLKTQNLIPSLSYSYTAGASYGQQNGVNGSLTLGGYDASRFTPNDVSFTFAPTVDRQLVVAIPSITFSTSKSQKTLLKDGILALVDSTVPHMWLPQDVCEAFESAFGIVWDPIRSLYTMNDTTHNNLIKSNPSVTFELSNSLNGPSTNITLPYASFDLTATYPLVKNQTRFFPLQRGNDDSQYTLGRTFLQEAFLIVDYEHSNFSISQAAFDPKTPSHIVAISPSTTGGTASNPGGTGSPIVKTTGNSSHSIGTGAIAGIAIAIVLIGALVGAFFLRRHLKARKIHKKRAELEGDGPADEAAPLPEMDIVVKKDIPDADGLEAKNRPTTIEVKEVPMTPPLSEMDANITGFFAPNGEKRPHPTMELPGSPVSPEPWSRPELPSPDPEALRSELSTPEPLYHDTELPTPEPRVELPSPGISAASSPGLDPQRRSALNSPLPRLPMQRPKTERLDSSESEAGFTRDGMRRPNFHRRINSDDSDVPSLQSVSRPIMSSRLDSSDSETGLVYHAQKIDNISTSDIVSPVSTSNRPRLPHQESSASESESLPTLSTITRPRISPTYLDSSSGEESPGLRQPTTFRHVVGLDSNFYSSTASRPAMPRGAAPQQSPQSGRIPESDSEEWETRLESPSTEAPSDVSRFNSVNLGKP